MHQVTHNPSPLLRPRSRQSDKLFSTFGFFKPLSKAQPIFKADFIIAMCTHGVLTPARFDPRIAFFICLWFWLNYDWKALENRPFFKTEMICMMVYRPASSFLSRFCFSHFKTQAEIFDSFKADFSCLDFWPGIQIPCDSTWYIVR